MPTLTLLPTLASAIFCLTTPLTAADTVAAFSKLAAGDTLQVRFTSGGCFHFYTYEMVFTRDAKATVSMAAVHQKWVGPGDAYRDGEHQQMGTVSLSEIDLAGLDSLLTFYRTNSATGCTTRDRIKISHIRVDKVLATEEFTDASCQARRTKGILTLPSLAARLWKKDE